MLACLPNLIQHKQFRIINSHICTSCSHACCTPAGGFEACVGLSSKSTDSRSPESKRDSFTLDCILLKSSYKSNLSFQYFVKHQPWRSVKVGGCGTWNTGKFWSECWFGGAEFWSTADNINASLGTFSTSAAAKSTSSKKEKNFACICDTINKSKLVINKFYFRYCILHALITWRRTIYEWV